MFQFGKNRLKGKSKDFVKNSFVRDVTSVFSPFFLAGMLNLHKAYS